MEGPIFDLRRGRVASYTDARDTAFREDTILHRIRHDGVLDGMSEIRSISDYIHFRFLERIVTDKDLAKFIAKRLENPTPLLFCEAYLISCVMDLAREVEGGGVTKPERDISKLLGPIEQFFEGEFTRLTEELKAVKQQPTSHMLAAQGDIRGLRDLVANLRSSAKSSLTPNKPKQGFSLFRRRQHTQPLTEEDPLLETDNDDSTILHIAVRNGFLDCVRAILEDATHYASPDTLHNMLVALGNVGHTAMAWAIENKNMDIIKELYQAGYDLTECNIKEEASRGRDTWKCGLEVLVTGSACLPTIFIPLLRETLTMVKGDSRFDINRRYTGRRAPRTGSLPQDEVEGDDDEEDAAEVAEIHRMIERRFLADDEDGDYQGLEAEWRYREAMLLANWAAALQQTLLERAAAFCGIDCIRVLLDAGAMATGSALRAAIDSFNHPPLPEYGDDRVWRQSRDANIEFGALGMDMHVACIDMLVEAGADVNEAGTFKQTALHLAACSGQMDVVKILVAKKANIALKDEGGKTAAELASLFRHSDIEDFLSQQSRLRRLLSPPLGTSSKRSALSSKGATVETNESNQCVICYQRRREVILAPCGHKIMCKRCTRRIIEGPEEKRTCPLDMEKIECFVTHVYEN